MFTASHILNDTDLKLLTFDDDVWDQVYDKGLSCEQVLLLLSSSVGGSSSRAAKSLLSSLTSLLLLLGGCILRGSDPRGHRPQRELCSHGPHC